MDESIDLEAVLKRHKEWLESGGKKGERADLRRRDLSGADLSGRNLSKADLRVANLLDADLRGANFEFAELGLSNLIGADLRGTTFGGADFNNASVYGVKYNRKSKFFPNRGIATCHGSPQFIRFVQDHCYLAEFKDLHPIPYWGWLFLCDCGRSLALLAFWAGVLAVAFGCAFYSLGEGAFETPYLPWCRETMIYYSVVTFTTLGFGDVLPKTLIAARLVMMEVLLGYMMLGGLISILANKIARRS